MTTKINYKHMKLLNIFSIFLLTIITISCSLEEFDSGIVPTKPGAIVTYEYLNSYSVLRTYIDTTSNQDFKLGAYLGADGFLEKGTLYSLVKSNFTEITSYDVFSHGAVVKDDGTMDFSKADRYIEEAKASKLDIFGQSLCWHSEQNGTFLNGRYSPKEYETPSFPNLLDKSGLIDGSFNGWETNTVNGSSIEPFEYNGDSVIKLISGPNSSNPDDLRLTSSGITVTETTYEVTMFILSDKGGTGRFTFEGLTNNTPELDWTGSGSKSDTFSINQGWNKISFQLNDFAEENIKFHLDLGYKPNVNYYVHIKGLSVVDINGEFENPDEIFLEAEDGVVGSNWTIEDDTDASGGKYAVVSNGIGNNVPRGDDPVNIISFTFTVNTPGEYKFWIRHAASVGSGSDDSYYIKVNDGSWQDFINNLNITSFGWVIMDTLNFSAGTNNVMVQYREDGAKLDRLYFTLTDRTPTDFGSPAPKTNKINLDLETAEKVTAVGGSLTNYISSVVAKFKDNVNAWVVVNEPMDDNNPSELKTGNGTDLENEFYWQDYLGKDYAVRAFNSARANVKQGDLLFISDYGLESNLEKCSGLIAYINYIEDQGATVDGIAVQMHLSLESSLDNISSMFQLLAKTGKVIKVAQLEVTIPSGIEITDETLQQQADMYKYAVNSFFQNVPATQRYGIEITGLRDSASNTSGLWDGSYNRKPAYAGFADGIIDNQ